MARGSGEPKTVTVSEVVRIRRRLGALEGRIDAMENHITKAVADSALAAANTTQILDVLTSAKSVAGFVRKHGPRAIAFGIGVLVAGGYVSAETGRSFLSIFGL